MLSSERAYATTYLRLMVTLAQSFTVSKIWPVFGWKTHIFYPFHSPSNLKTFPLNCILQILYATASAKS